ncbi:MAG: PQQ-binding-like beta-propeller repeat protein [Pirellulales bacterium]
MNRSPRRARSTFLSLSCVFVVLAGSAVVVLAGGAPAVAQSNWPQFRGPDGQGHADAAQLPVTWSEDEHVTWKTPIPGTGWSSPVIWDGQIWMTTATDEGRSLRAVCVDSQSGEVLHDVEVFHHDEVMLINPKNSYASPTPVIEAGRLYVNYGTLGTACLDTARGEVFWRNEKLLLDHKEGPGSSPILYGNLLLIHCDGIDVQYVIALDKQTGETVWQTWRSQPMDDNPDFCKAYSTPLVINVGGRDQLISVGAHWVYSYDPATGQENWMAGFRGFSNVPRPVYDGEHVYVCTGFMKPQLLAIRPDGAGDVTESHVDWNAARQVPNNPSPILVDGMIFMASDRGVATCLDAATGEEHWVERLEGNFSASPIYASGRLYFPNEQGQTFVVAAAPEFELLATNTLDDGHMASFAVTGDALIVRTRSHLYRIED